MQLDVKTSFRPPSALSAAPGEAAEWLRAGQSASVAGIRVDGGLFYLGQNLPAVLEDNNEKFLVDPTLPVAPDNPDFEGYSIGYWPSYANMSPQARRAFLLWMAEGRSRRDIHPAFVLLHLYGLERRLLLDRATDEARDILSDIHGLAAQYVHLDSVRKVLRAVIEAATLVLTRDLPLTTTLPESADRVPMSVIYAIGKAIAAGKPVDPNLVFNWVMSAPTRNFSLPAGETFAEIRGRFLEHVASRRPRGLIFDASRIPGLRFPYRAQGGSFIIELCEFLDAVPDVTRGSLAWMEAQALVRDSLERRHRRQSDPNPPVHSTFTASAVEIKSNPYGKAVLHEWAREQLEHNCSISLRAALKRLRGQSPKMLARAEIERLADVLAQVGIGIVSDPRFAMTPNHISEDALLFRLSECVEGHEPASDAYQAALLLVTVAMSVAKSDGDIAREELELIEQLIGRAAGLSQNDRARLLAERQWMHMRPLPLSPVFDAVSRLTDRQRHELIDLVCNVVHADGHFPEIERVFAAAMLGYLGLSQDEASTRLRREVAKSLPASPAAYPIDVWDEENFDEQLEVRNLIYPPKVAIAAERELSGFNQIIEPITEGSWIKEAPSIIGEQQTIAQTDVSSWSTDSLDEKHRRLLAEIVLQTEWNRRALEQIARTQRLMTDGAIETLNEWAYDASGDLLLEVDDSGTVIVNQFLVHNFKGAA